MKLFKFIFGTACLSAAVGAFAVESAICVFITESTKPYAKRYNAEKVADNVSRIVIPKGDVPKDINFIEVIADSAVVKRAARATGFSRAATTARSSTNPEPTESTGA